MSDEQKIKPRLNMKKKKKNLQEKLEKNINREYKNILTIIRTELF